MTFSNKLAKIVFATATCVVFALSFLLYKRVLHLDDSYREVNQNNLVKLKLEQILSTLKDAESAQRGYLLTKDSVFLEPYFGGYDRISRLMTEVRALTEKNAVQQKNLDALTTFIEVRFRAFRTQIDQFNSPEESPTARKLHLLSGKASLDMMRGHIEQVARTEDQLLAEREARKDYFRYLTPLFALSLIITILVILVFSYVKIIQQLNRSRELLALLRALNRKMKQKNYELELYNKELDSFTYIASHDLKEPLRKILTFSGMIEETEHGSLTPANKMNLTRIRQSAWRMQKLLDDLLRYSHTSLSEKSFEKVDLNRAVAEVQRNLEDEIRETGTTFNLENLPVVMGLSFQLKQLFENLISNSIKYRQEGLAPVITISCSRVSREQMDVGIHRESSFYYRILYSDNGIGFAQVHAEKIFELFRRVHTRTSQSGTGIGLTICKKIVQNHNGFVRAKSAVNQGTTFEIYLPCEESAVARIEEAELAEG